ncbi:response regulator [Desulfotignum balticum]|jgi:putative two-component system response regulator|uniref:response regulator n=1 Tax=Desulfotignum balticum TaxID=115781 RepID=UPI0003FB35D8|nr:two-component system response regulator [Desulfotignum balticum]
MENEAENATIMVVDDTPDNLALMGEMLFGRGYRVLELASGKQALKAIKKCRPDLILLDVQMPDMDGFEVCRQIKEDDRFRQIPVIFVSAHKEIDIRLKALNGGGIDFISKPFQELEVLARVEIQLKVQQLQRRLARQNSHLENLVKKKVKDVYASQLATIKAVTKLAECRDDQTGCHIERTREFCGLLAGKLGEDSCYAHCISDDFINHIYHAAPLHDIGKVSIADNILLKPGKLTPEEFEKIKTHTVLGAETLESVRRNYPENGFINMGIEIARSHHERWDGKGYPDGLSGEKIPLSARIMAVADVYDALRSRRPYKQPFSHEKACAIIQKDAGTHFDPAVVAAFVSLESSFADLWERLNDDGKVCEILPSGPPECLMRVP